MTLGDGRPVRPHGVDSGELLPAGLSDPAGSSRFRVVELDHSVIASTPYVRARLDSTSPRVLLTEQLATLDGEALYLRVGYHPLQVDPESLSRAITALDRSERFPGTRRTFEILYGVPYGSHESVLEAVPCEARTGLLLGVPAGAPVLLREQLIRDRGGRGWDLSYTYFRGDLLSIVHRD